MVIYRVMLNFSNIFQPILMSLFTWSLLAISGALLIIQVQLVKYSFAFVLAQNEDSLLFFINFSTFSKLFFRCTMEISWIYSY